MLALRSLGSSSLSRISGKSGIVGHAMISCILCLAPVSCFAALHVESTTVGKVLNAI
jgi:hypothetical protein